MRRILIIIASVIVLLGVGVGVYFYFFAGGPTLAVAPTPSSALPSAGANANTTAVAGPSDAGVSPASVPAATRVSERLVKISAGPVVPGEAVVDIAASTTKSTATSTPVISSTADVNVAYIEQQSGNVFSYLVRAGHLTRTSNKTLPGIAEASWLPSGQTAFVHYLSGTTLSTINTYGLSADGSGGFFLPQNLASIAVSSTSVLTLASGTSGSVASLLHADGTHAALLFSSPLSALRVAFAGKGGYLAFTKPAASLPGYLFVVNTGGAFTRIAGPLLGLVALPSPSGKVALVSFTAGSTMRMELVDTTSGQVTPLPVATIADKCAWAADSSAIYCGVPVAPSSDYAYPDDWYQGAIHFSDRIWKISVAGRFAQLVLDPSSAKATIDATALAIDPLTTTLVFLNKNDGSLWSYQL